MKPLDEGTLREHLERRVRSTLMSSDERDLILRAVKAERTTLHGSNSRPLNLGRWLGAAAAALSLALLVALVVKPPLSQGPVPSGSLSAHGTASLTPAPGTSSPIGTNLLSPAAATPSATDPGSDDGLYEQARAALDRWEEAVGDASPNAVVFTTELTRGGGWRGPGAGDKKSALLSGLIEAPVDLPSESPPPGEVVWEDGSTATVSLFSATDALEDLKASMDGGSCSGCRTLEVTGARLINRQAETARGLANVPAWEFTFVDTDTPLHPVTHIAVRDRIVLSPFEGADAPMVYAVGQPQSQSLTVAFIGSPGTGESWCGADYTAEAVESDLAVVVIVRSHRHPAPDSTPHPCPAIGATRTAVAELNAPLGSRTVLDLGSGVPITLHQESPVAIGDFPSEIDGEGVHTADEAIARVAASDSAESFLVGGYTRFVQADCFVPSDFPFTPLLAPCGDGFLLSSSLATDGVGLRLVILEGTVVGLTGHKEPAVLRVHGHDPLAAECPPNYRDQCEAAIVVDELVWLTPAAGSPSPEPTVAIDTPTLAVGNWSTLVVSVFVNGKDVAVVAPGEVQDPVDPRIMPALPWNVEVATWRGGRVLLGMTVRPGDVWDAGPDPIGGLSAHGVGNRVDLSCGRIDIWSGPPLLGPGPPSSYPPGDCDPGGQGAVARSGATGGRRG